MNQIVWNHNHDRHEYESDDWRWQIALSVGGRYDVRDLTEREWVAFGYTLEQAKEFCQARNDEQFGQMKQDYLTGSQ